MSGSHFDGGDVSTVLVLLLVGAFPPERGPGGGGVVGDVPVGRGGADLPGSWVDGVPERVVEDGAAGSRAGVVSGGGVIAVEVRVGPHLPGGAEGEGGPAGEGEVSFVHRPGAGVDGEQDPTAGGILHPGRGAPGGCGHMLPVRYSPLRGPRNRLAIELLCGGGSLWQFS